MAAAALAIGVIAGLYLRGFSFLYKAGWDSTFMEAEGVHTVLSTLFTPASWLLGISMPAVEAIADLRGTAKANAAIWIHFWAVTTGLFIILPRTLLAAAAWMRTARRADPMHLPNNAPYFQRLLNPYPGKGLRRSNLSHAKEADDRLLAFLSDAFGVLADIHMGNSVQYGEPLPHFSVDPDRALCAVALFNVAQAPEETHSEFLEELKTTVRGRGRPNMLLVLLDCEAYAQIDHEKRLRERCQAWTTLAKECGLQAMKYRDPSGPPDGELQALPDCLWPGDFRGHNEYPEIADCPLLISHTNIGRPLWPERCSGRISASSPIEPMSRLKIKNIPCWKRRPGSPCSYGTRLVFPTVKRFSLGCRGPRIRSFGL